ncbi:MAG: LCP family protein [Eubacteriaceae bacterium]|nr:LCP family protein [Eubacteriaceae bacterium]
MRSDKYQESGYKFKSFTRGWAMIYFLATIGFLAVLVYTDMLPFNLLWKAAAVVGVLFLITFPVLRIRSFKTSRKKVAFFFSLILTIGYLVGITYLTGTMGFFSNITSLGGETEKYFVVVNAESSYEDINDIDGLNVTTLDTKETSYANAKEELLDKVNVEYVLDESLSNLGNSVLDNSDQIVLLSEGHYTAVSEEHKNYETDTRIIYTIKVKLEDVSNSKAVNVKKEPFNILVSGIDTSGEIDQVSRSDVNMVVSINPETHKVLLTSIPRDTLVKLKGKGDATDKLTHAGIYGIGESIASVEDLLGIDINYYVKVNYSTVMKLVDAIGGVDVVSEYTFTTSGMHMDGLDGLTFYEGENHLDGAAALAFARERHSFASGDLQRNKNQQIVLEAILKKMLSSKTLLTKYSGILNSIEDNVETNFSPKEIKQLIKLQLKDMPSWKIKKRNISGVSDSAVCYSTGDYYVSVVVADTESVAKAKAAIGRIFDGE